MNIELYDYQIDAIKRMSNGCILCSEVGTGKSRMSLGYYHKRGGGYLQPSIPMTKPKNLYIITTAKKRDSLEWDDDMLIFGLSQNPESCFYEGLTVKVDSWNNIKKYKEVTDSFFIFDEQRVVGYGAWTKSFLAIAKSNEWILLSATPGDTWLDYMPVFIANGFYRNKTDFIRQHVIYKRHTEFPIIDKYYDTGRLVRLRNRILIDIRGFERSTVSHHDDIYCEYDRDLYKQVMRTRQDPNTGEPFQNAAGFCQGLRKVVNSDESRITMVMEIVDKSQKVIIFYNYDYELELLKEAYYGDGFEVAEWNGHAHQEIPAGDKWVYLVQYNAGNEGWNCVRTNTIIFYSQNYSYKIMKQAAGRIDRLNTPFTDLYYYHLKSKSGIDLAIAKAIREKKLFNEGKFSRGN